LNTNNFAVLKIPFMNKKSANGAGLRASKRMTDEAADSFISALTAEGSSWVATGLIVN